MQMTTTEFLRGITLLMTVACLFMAAGLYIFHDVMDFMLINAKPLVWLLCTQAVLNYTLIWRIK